MRLASGVGDREAIFGSLLGLAEVAARSGGTHDAARLLGAADALREEVGYGPPDPSELEVRKRIANVLDENDPALVAAQSEGGAMTLDEAIELALSLVESRRGGPSALTASEGVGWCAAGFWRPLAAYFMSRGVSRDSA